ncbi:hypothetical protein [Stenotrophomonas lacuserhaii]|uniref:hypothetical protein n=1 Tax=Stenotrophomonas lacuserhaii TaxID=2760084 RepID=UPI0033045A0C
MQILNQLGLMFRATVLNQLAAKVRLASAHYSPSRFSAALTGIGNREQQLANRFSQGRLSVGQLYRQASRLASQDVLLNTRLRPDSDCHEAVARQPVATASAFRSVLVRAYCAATEDRKQALGALLAPAMVRARARCMLADAVWLGHITRSDDLLAQVRRLAHLEAVDSACPLDQMVQLERRAAREILHFVAEQQPDGPDEAWHAVRRMLGSAASALLPAEPDSVRPVPTSWTQLAAHARSGSGVPHSFEVFRDTMECAVVDALALREPDVEPAEQVCQCTFELLEYIRQQVNQHALIPRSCNDHALPSLWEEHAVRLERQAVDRLLLYRAGTASAAQRGSSSSSA